MPSKAADEEAMEVELLLVRGEQLVVVAVAAAAAVVVVVDVAVAVVVDADSGQNLKA